MIKISKKPLEYEGLFTYEQVELVADLTENPLPKRESLKSISTSPIFANS